MDVNLKSPKHLIAKVFEQSQRHFMDREANLYVLEFGVGIVLAFHCDKNSKVFSWNAIYEFCEVELDRTPFAIFRLYNWDQGPLQPRSSSAAEPGIYAIFNPDGSELMVSVLIDGAMGELIENVSPECVERVRQRDQRCLITGTKVTPLNENEFMVVNILRPDHFQMWHELESLPVYKDRHADVEFANLSRQTIRNAFLIRSDLAEAWNRGEITVDIKQDHAIMAFKKALQYLHGRKLYLEHLNGPDAVAIAPLDVFFDEHKISAIALQVLGN